MYLGANPYALVKTMGCGIQYIWVHYGQVDVERMAKDLTKKVKYDKKGFVVIKLLCRLFDRKISVGKKL